MELFQIKDGKEIIVRTAFDGDAQGVLDLKKLMFETNDPEVTLAEEYSQSVDEEKEWINNYLFASDTLILVAEYEGKIIGMLDFANRESQTFPTSGEFGIVVHQDFQGLGLGKILIENLLNWTKCHPDINKVFLTVFETNTVAIKLYQNLGFVEEVDQDNFHVSPSGKNIALIRMSMET